MFPFTWWRHCGTVVGCPIVGRGVVPWGKTSPGKLLTGSPFGAITSTVTYISKKPIHTTIWTSIGFTWWYTIWTLGNTESHCSIGSFVTEKSIKTWLTAVGTKLGRGWTTLVASTVWWTVISAIRTRVPREAAIGTDSIGSDTCPVPAAMATR